MTFFDRIDELKEMVGSGKLVAKVSYDQVYAAVQHEGGWLTGPNAGKRISEHPGGGGGKYLQGPLLEEASGFFEHVADEVLDVGALHPMVDNAEKLADDSSERAPIEFGDLRQSAHPTVTDDGKVVFDRPPMVPRLSEAQLEAKAKGRARGDYRRTYLPKSHPLHGSLHEANGGPKAEKPKAAVDER